MFLVSFYALKLESSYELVVFAYVSFNRHAGGC